LDASFCGVSILFFIPIFLGCLASQKGIDLLDMAKDGDLKIEILNTSDLIPYARNSRTHSPEQVGQIAGSIREFGFTNPVLIDGDNNIIAGHCRVMAAGKLGLKEVPCIRLGHLSEAQKRAYIIADNKLAMNASWDEELLALELSDLREGDFDLDLTGFDAGWIEAALNPPERDDTPPESSGGEVDVDAMKMECQCPKCGFEFDPK
jgi:ParB-like chromosome segregation protein Spo0J